MKTREADIKSTRSLAGVLLVGLALSFVAACGGSSSTGTTSTSGESIKASTGGSQSAAVGAGFSAPLVAQVTSGGSPVSGVSVTFTAPTSGASGTFNGGKTTVTATTDSSGNASVTFTANQTLGTYAVVATAANVSGTANFDLMNISLGSITATAGINQSTNVNTPFSLPLVATVMENGSATSGVKVTFTAPASGASGVFTGGTNTVSATSDSSGNATVTFTANGTAGGPYSITATAPGIAGDAIFTMTNLSVATPTIEATGGTPQSTLVGTAFAQPLQATMTGTTQVSGVEITFVAPASGASGTFANGTNTEKDTTNANGVATSSTFKANGTFGSYSVMATAANVSNIAIYSLTNNTSLTGATLYSFYLSGLEAINSGPNFYALAGSVAVDSDGTVIAGEQDYNDGLGLTSPQPSGDSITGGTLTVDATTGQGTLTLDTNNTNLGVNGVETLGVQFVNAKHALIIQFDGTATSSGSMDFQTLPSTLNGGYAFTLSGVDTSYASVVYGGVFTITATNFAESGGTLQGIFDIDDFGQTSTPTLGTTFSNATISAPDEFGRGTIEGTGIADTLNYYTIGPEAIRIIDVDNASGIHDTAIGSAFGQGSTTFTNASLGSSVFGVQSNWFGNIFAAAGMFTTDTSNATLSGTADDNEVQNGIQASAASITGSYSISKAVSSITYNGYGSLTINSGDLGDVSVLGIYMTDPNLNLSDPNNASGGGGALLADLDGFDLNGIGIATPQTNTSAGSFTGSYAYGAQEFNLDINGGEFDFLGQGTVSNLALSGIGMVSDPWAFFTSGTTDSSVTFSGTAAADPSHAGRYTLPLGTSLTTTAGDDNPFSVVVYQASGDELFWLETDTDSLFLGTLQQQGSLSGLPAVEKNRGNIKSK